MEVKLFKLIWEYFKINIQNAMEYRLNFILETTFMVFNDVLWVFYWWIFFSKFEIINTWKMGDMLLLYAMICISWGALGIFFGNFMEMAQIIKDGKLDFYLSLPKEELSHLLVSGMRFHAFGDVIFGILVAVIFIPIIKWPLLLILILLSTIILLSFAIIVGSITFFIGSSAELAKSAMFSLLTIASYPLEIFKKHIKLILLTIIPAGFVTGIPVELLRSFNLKWFLIMIVFTLIFFLIAISIFKFGVRKYESGNLINVRV